MFDTNCCVDCLEYKKSLFVKCGKCPNSYEKLTTCYVGEKQYKLCLKCLHKASKLRTFSMKLVPRKKPYWMIEKEHREEKMAIGIAKRNEETFPSIYFPSDPTAIPSLFIGTIDGEIGEYREIQVKDKTTNEPTGEKKKVREVFVKSAIMDYEKVVDRKARTIDWKFKPNFSGRMKIGNDFWIKLIEDRVKKSALTGKRIANGVPVCFFVLDMTPNGKYPDVQCLCGESSKDTVADIFEFLTNPIHLVDNGPEIIVLDEINVKLDQIYDGALQIPKTPHHTFVTGGVSDENGAMSKILKFIKEGQEKGTVKNHAGEDDIPF